MVRGPVATERRAEGDGAPQSPGLCDLSAALREAAAPCASCRARAGSAIPANLFVGIDMATQRWRSIFSTVGVSRLICGGDAPQAVPDRIVDALRAREDEAGLVRLDLRPSFRSGDKICVLDGALAGCFGLYEGMKDSERVAVLLDLLGRKVRVIVDAEKIEAA